MAAASLLKNRLPTDPLDEKLRANMYLSLIFGLKFKYSYPVRDTIQCTLPFLFHLNTATFPGAIANLKKLVERGDYNGLKAHEWSDHMIRFGDNMTNPRDDKYCIGQHGKSFHNGLFYSEGAVTLPKAGDLFLHSFDRDDEFESMHEDGFVKFMYHSMMGIATTDHAAHALGHGWGLYPVIGKLISDDDYEMLDLCNHAMLVYPNQRLPLHDLIVVDMKVFEAVDDAQALDIWRYMPKMVDVVDISLSFLQHIQTAMAHEIEEGAILELLDKTLNVHEAAILLRAFHACPSLMSKHGDKYHQLARHWYSHALVPVCGLCAIPIETVPDAMEQPLEALLHLRHRVTSPAKRFEVETFLATL